MKKLSLLVVLALLITVGGVYATWTYTSASADIVDASKEIVVQLADATTTGAAGTFHVESNLGLVIDQDDDASQVHSAKLVYKLTGNDNPQDSAIAMTITFTPSANASQTIRDNAVPAELYFSTTTEMKYPADANGFYNAGGSPKNIFVLSNTANDNFEGNPSTYPEKAVAWTKQSDGTFTATYTLAQMKTMIQLNSPIILDTKADYDAFKLLLNGNIVANVTDGTVQNSGGSSGQG